MAAIGVLAGDLDDLDALGGEVLLDLRQELLDLLGGEVVDRDRFEEVLGGDEAALPPLGGDRFLDFVQAHRRVVQRRFANGTPQDVSHGEPSVRKRSAR